MLIHYTDGRVLTGILLSLKGNQMRVAVKDAEDVGEFRLVNGVWISECCEPVSFEFPTAIFEAVGIVPDADHLNPTPDVIYNRETAAAATVNQTN